MAHLYHGVVQLPELFSKESVGAVDVQQPKYNALSLLQCSANAIVCNSNLTEYCVGLGLPKSIHVMMFSAATTLVPKKKRLLRGAIKTLVSTWPEETLNIKDIIGKTLAKEVLMSGRNLGIDSLVVMLMEGLVNMTGQSRLQRVDFTAYYIPVIFQLPWLYLSEDDRCSDTILNEIHDKCQQFAVENDDNLDSVLAWKLADINKRGIEPNYHGKEKIKIVVECQITFTDWLGMIDEMIGLILHHRSPFSFSIARLNIDNFHVRQTRHFKWLLSMLEKKEILYLTLCGFFRSMSRIFYDFEDEFSELTNVQIFGMAATGPNILAFSNINESDVLNATCKVYANWKSLREVYYNRVSLANNLEALLSNLQQPLRTIYCYHCYLTESDIKYLADSHHANAVQTLVLDYNKLEGFGKYICDFISKASSLKVLNLKNTGLLEEERIQVLCSLQACPNIDTLVLYEEDDMVSTECYETMVQLACTLPSLKTFYLFPLRYEPFDQFYRDIVLESCQEILSTSRRTDLELWYS